MQVEMGINEEEKIQLTMNDAGDAMQGIIVDGRLNGQGIVLDTHNQISE
jgi:hypothetical protein